MNKKTLIAILLLSIFLLNCGGGGSGGSSSPNGEKPGVPEIVQVLPSHYIALTNSAILIRAKILNGNGGPVKGYPVTFTNLSPIGTLINGNDVAVGNKTVVKTNNSGMATIKLKSTISGFATVLAEVAKGVGIVRDRKTVYFSSSLSFVPFMYLDANGDTDTVYNEVSDYTLFENENDNKVTMRATVFSKFGQREAGSTVVFSSDSTEVTFPGGRTATTNADGEAFILVQVDPAALRNLWTYVNIMAVADNGAAAIYTLYLQPVIVNSLAVTANPSIIAPNGTSTIQASVKLNTGGAPPDGSAVNFVTTCGSVTPFAQTTSGLATATFTAPSTVPTPDPNCRVTATLAGVSNFADVTVSSALNVQPPSQIINANYGGTASYTIYGGIAPYTVISNNKAHACNSTDADCSDATDTGTWDVADNGGIFTATVPANVTTVNETITFNVRDSVGNTTTATLSIGGAASLAVLPSSVSIDGTAGGEIIFTIYGGNPGYSIFVNKADPAFAPNPASVGSSGGTFKVTIPPSTPAGSVVYTVRDSQGETTTATVTITSVAPAGLTIIPGKATVIGAAPADTVTFTVSGGTSPYVITSSDPANAYDSAVGDGIWNVASSGGTFNVIVPANAASGDVTINVFDAAGNTKTATLSIIAGSATAGLQLNPAAVSVTGVSGATDSVPFVITGGTGPYTMASSNTAVIPTVAVAGSTFSVNPNPVSAVTAVTITVIDSSSGLTDNSIVTVTPALSTMALNPSSITVSQGTNNISFSIIGGISPFTVYSSNIAVVTLDGGTPSGPNAVAGTSFTADAVGAGTSTITVVDSDGNTKTSNVTVTSTGGGAGTILVLPGTVTVIGAAPADTVTFTVSGGIPPYVVTSTDPSSACNSVTSADTDCVDATDSGIWSVLTSGGTFPVTVPVNAATGDITLNVFDSLGNTGTAKLSIIQGSTATGMTLNPASISVTGLTGTTDNVTFTITGGTSPYTAFSSNTAIAPVTLPVVGSTFIVTPEVVFTSTGVTITAMDSLGLTKTATITVTPASSSLGVNPSTIAVKTGTTISFNIIGGVSNYNVYSSNTSYVFPGANPLNTAGPSFNVTTANPGPGSVTETLTIVDSDGKTVTASVTVNP